MREPVLVISNMYPCAADRAHGSFVARCVEALRRGGVPVQTAVMPRPATRWHGLAAYLRFAWQANRQLMGRRHAAVWIHQPLHSLLVALPTLWLVRAPVVLNFHGHDLLPVTRRGRLLRRLLRARFVAAPRVLLPSRHFQRLFDDEFGAGRSFVFPSGGVDLCHFEPAPPLAGRAQGVLFLSRWVEGKGWARMLALASRLAQAGSPLTVTIAGTGPDEDRIRAAIVQAGLGPRVRLVACDDAATAAALMRQHRYFVLPSHFDESLALVNLEAMAGGCVVLTRDFEAARDYLIPGVNGYGIAGAHFVRDCAAVVLGLEQDPALAQRIADAAQVAACAWAEPRVMATLPAMLGLVRP